jgi:hypothetical protein
MLLAAMAQHQRTDPSLKGRLLKVAQSSRGAWPLARTGSLQTALTNAVLYKHGFLMPSDLAATM